MTIEFFEAIRQGDVGKVRALLHRDRSLVNAKTEAGFSAVIVAKLRGQAAVLGEIVAANPTLDIHDAAYLGDVRRTRQLLDADPSALDSFSSDGYTPLDLASYFGHAQLVAFLVDRGAQVEHEIRNENLFTALTGAVAEGHLSIAKLLLDHGANVNHRYAEGATPLLTAAANGDLPMVRLLLAHGASGDLQNESGQTAVDVAAERGQGTVVTLLRAREFGKVADPEDPIRVSPESYEIALENDGVRVLLESLGLGAVIARHHHPDHIVIAISGGRLGVTSVHGRKERFEVDSGDALWFPAGAHEIENLGQTTWRAAIVELKPAKRRD